VPPLHWTLLITPGGGGPRGSHQHRRAELVLCSLWQGELWAKHQNGQPSWGTATDRVWGPYNFQVQMDLTVWGRLWWGWTPEKLQVLDEYWRPVLTIYCSSSVHHNIQPLPGWVCGPSLLQVVHYCPGTQDCLSSMPKWLPSVVHEMFFEADQGLHLCLLISFHGEGGKKFRLPEQILRRCSLPGNRQLPHFVGKATGPDGVSPAGSCVHGHLQRITAAVRRPSVLQKDNHCAVTQEDQGNRPHWLSSSGFNTYSH